MEGMEQITWHLKLRIEILVRISFLLAIAQISSVERGSILEATKKIIAQLM